MDRFSSYFSYILGLNFIFYISSLHLSYVCWAKDHSFQEHAPYLSGEIFTQLSAIEAGVQRISNFELSRAEFGMQSAPQVWAWELRLEGIRSAGQDSLMGIDGDSFILRVKRAWGSYQLEKSSWSLVTRIGLIPDLWHLRIMSAFPLRALGASQGEREGFQDTSDLGASWTLSAYDQSIFLSVSNGEGRRYPEQNQGKNVLIGLQLSAPLFEHRTYLSIAYQDGSKGPSSSRNHRLYGVVCWPSSRLNLGITGTYAWGYRARPEQEVLAIQGWLATWIFPKYLGIYALGEDVKLQAGSSDHRSTRWTMGFSQRFQQTPKNTAKKQSNGLSITFFESLDYQSGSALLSPVVGQAHLAQQWRLMFTLSVAWGVRPLHAQVMGHEQF